MYTEGIGQSEGAQGTTWHEGKVHRCSLTRTASLPFLCLRNLRISVHDLWISLALRSQSKTTKDKKAQAIDQKSFSLLILSESLLKILENLPLHTHLHKLSSQFSLSSSSIPSFPPLPQNRWCSISLPHHPVVHELCSSLLKALSPRSSMILW